MNMKNPDLKLTSSGDIKTPDSAAEGLSHPHESARAHVTGAALYVDDVALPVCMSRLACPSTLEQGFYLST